MLSTAADRKATLSFDGNHRGGGDVVVLPRIRRESRTLSGRVEVYPGLRAARTASVEKISG